MEIILPANAKLEPRIIKPTDGDWQYRNRLYRPGSVVDGFTVRVSNQVMYDWGAAFTSSFYPRLALSTTETQTPPALPVETREMPVIGYRAWRLQENFQLGKGTTLSLHSTGMGYDWKRDGNVAECTSSAVSHTAPDQHCGCGLYVLANLDELDGHVEMGNRMIVGAVMGWGRVVQHGSEGWRAANAKILALLDCQYSKKQAKNTAAAAEAYGLEVKSRAQIEALVREYGDPLQ